MKKNRKIAIALTLIFTSFLFMLKAQDASVEKSTFGIQTGFLGIWSHCELKLAREVAIRGEIGMNAGFFGSGDNKTGYLLAPVFTMEPRWYYNLDKRQNKSKNISGNSGDFLTIQLGIHPNSLIISNDENYDDNINSTLTDYTNC